MLNMILMADCDECGKTSDNLAIALSPQQHAEAVKMLIASLHEDGWHIFHERYRCSDCILAALANQKNERIVRDQPTHSGRR